MSDAKNIFVLGGASSGKSSFALSLAEPLSPSSPSGARGRLYIATAVANDVEMAERIAAHKDERAGFGWETVEEPVKVAEAINSNFTMGEAGGGVILIDCLTLWLANIVEAGCTDKEIRGETERLIEAIMNSPAAVVTVSNEL
ncbi:MAG: bifunctional adenosylcobinamide kinase/adenosylcobinamide-phosphate guanylyltransferase, partial [Thermodesulfobacteriota bacterium]